ncbi:head GIN domain-containing protein [Ascidiimonas sp. W6]|uniref:head GIN domain-containing protein n=1 Tax=Ascidiimonas meishanensis TaxID=3128903 RepID=UPI0030EE50A9
MKYLVGIMFLVSSIAIAQDGLLQQELEKFDEIKVFDGISVELIKANENKIEVTGSDVDEIAIINKRGRLKIRMEIDRIFSGYKTFVKIYHTEAIYLIDANENAFIEIQEPLKQINVTLRTQEGGQIKAALDVQRLEVKSVTGGVIETTGSAKNQDILINTGGVYEGDALKTEQTEVDVNAGGKAYVNASNYVKASVRAGGKIRIYGDPKVIDKKTFLGGRIIEQ